MEQNIVLSWGHIWVIIAGLFGAGAFFYKLIDKKFDKIDEKIDQKFNKVDEKFEKLQYAIKEVNDRLSSFEKNAEHRLTKLEMEAKSTNQRLSTIENFLIPKKIYQFENPEAPHADYKEAKEN